MKHKNIVMKDIRETSFSVFGYLSNGVGWNFYLEFWLLKFGQ